MMFAFALVTFLFTRTEQAAPHSHVYVHYDYLVYTDHSDEPDPKAIQMVVDAYAAHGIDLVIDPKHTAIPDSKLQFSIWVSGQYTCAPTLATKLEASEGRWAGGLAEVEAGVGGTIQLPGDNGGGGGGGSSFVVTTATGVFSIAGGNITSNDGEIAHRILDSMRRADLCAGGLRKHASFSEYMVSYRFPYLRLTHQPNPQFS